VKVKIQLQNSFEVGCNILIDMKISKLRENLMRKLCVFSKRFDLFIIGPT